MAKRGSVSALERRKRAPVSRERAAAGMTAQTDTTDEDLRALEARYRALVLATGQITWTARLDGGEWRGDSRDWSLFTGQAPEEARERGRLDTLHPDDRERALSAWTAAVASRSTYEIDCRVRRYDGAYRWLLVRGVPVLEPDGGVREWAGTTTDITGRKLSEERLRHLQEASDTFAEARSLDQVRGIVLGKLVRALGARGAGLRLVTAEGLVLDDLARDDDGRVPAMSEEILHRVSVVPLDTEHPAAEAVRNGVPVFIRDAQECIRRYPAFAGAARQNRTEAVAHLPLWRRGEVFAVLSLDFAEPHAWDEAERAFAQALAVRAGVAYERTHAAEALRASEERLAAIFQDAPFALVLSAPPKYRIVQVNDAFLRLFGFAREEVIGKTEPELDILHDPQARERIARLLQERDAVRDVECIARSKRGDVLHLSLNITIVTTGGDRCVLTAIEDVTERRRMERERRFQASMLERSHDAIFLRELGGPIVFWNRGAELLYGFTRDAALGRVSHELLQTQRSQLLKDFEASLDHEGEWTGELTHIARDGRRIVVMSRLQLLVEPDGRRYVLETSRDITEQLALMDALRESEEKFRTLADNIPTLAWMAHPDGNIFWYNRRWYAYTGTTPASQEGWGWQSVHHPDTLPEVIERWKASLASGEPFEMVFPLRGADGLFRPFLTRIVPVKDEQGRVVRWFGSNTDVSDLREAEEALQATNQLMDDFLHTATHELKSPLTALRANLQLSERRVQRLLEEVARMPAPEAQARAERAPGVDVPCGEDPLREAAEGITLLLDRNERQVLKLTRLVDDLVDAVRIQAGKLEIRPETCDLAALVREAVAEQRAIYPARTIRLQLPRVKRAGAPGGCCVPVVADADRIGQVVANYLTNAVKYSPGDCPVVVALRVKGDTARVSVRDEGPGIPAGEHVRLWERGHRVPGIEPSGEGVGLGLGLHISRSIVERHGGRVGVKSVPGTGSTFWFTLPLIQSIEEM